MSLAEYEKKRRFEVTPEPAGGKGPRARRRKPLASVIQKHRASHLHYDFRLVRTLRANPRLVTPPKKGRKSVWHSKKAVS